MTIIIILCAQGHQLTPSSGLIILLPFLIQLSSSNRAPVVRDLDRKPGCRHVVFSIAEPRPVGGDYPNPCFRISRLGMCAAMTPEVEHASYTVVQWLHLVVRPFRRCCGDRMHSPRAHQIAKLSRRDHRLAS
jgi:hypothetical protein